MTSRPIISIGGRRSATSISTAPGRRPSAASWCWAGALGDPTDQAMLLFEGDDGSAAEAFARADPYVVNGLVTGWRVRPWFTVVGPAAATPVRA